MAKLRAGRKVGRTLYVQRGSTPDDHDRLIGLLDEDWAEVLAHCYNVWIEAARHDTHTHFWRYHASFGQGWRECDCGVKEETDD